jgi:hypothetical protein
MNAKILSQAQIHSLFTLNESTGMLYWRIKPKNGIQIGDIAGSQLHPRKVGVQIRDSKAPGHPVNPCVHYVRKDNGSPGSQFSFKGAIEDGGQEGIEFSSRLGLQTL